MLTFVGRVWGIAIILESLPTQYELPEEKNVNLRGRKLPDTTKISDQVIKIDIPSVGRGWHCVSPDVTQRKEHNIISVVFLLKCMLWVRSWELFRWIQAKNHPTYCKACFLQNGMNMEGGGGKNKNKTPPELFQVDESIIHDNST